MKSKKPKTSHFKDEAFLTLLGENCKKIRTRRGYSIDRLSKESNQLSPSAVHRLETGSGPVTVLTLYRYAAVLDVSLAELFDFDYLSPTHSPVFSEEEKPTILPIDDSRARKEAFKSYLPLYSVEAAAGYFGNGKSVEPRGWIKCDGRRKFDSSTFVIKVKGHSMSPVILDGDYAVMRANPTGSIQGKIVLVQHRAISDPDTGGSYAIKRYTASKVISGRSTVADKQIILSPINPEFEPIILQSGLKDDSRVIAEYLFSIR